MNGKETPIDWIEAPAPSAAGASPAAPASAPAAAEAATAAVAARRMHSTVFVITDLHTGVKARNDGLQALRAYVDRMPAGEEAAVYLLDNGVRRLQAFTADRSALKTAIDKPAKTLPRSYIFPEQGTVEWEGQSRQMPRNFTPLLDPVAQLPETKTSSSRQSISQAGFLRPISGQRARAPPGERSSARARAWQPRSVRRRAFDERRRLRVARALELPPGARTESQALLARATIVAVDPTGLFSADGRAEVSSTSSPSGRPGRDSAATLRPADNTTEGDAVDSFAFRSDTFALIAESTGGARLGFTNKPLDNLVAETNLLARRYRLGFTPPDGTSARREIRVQVARPGLVVRAAAGQRSLTPETAARARFAALLPSADAPKGDFPFALETKAAVKDRKEDAFRSTSSCR